MKLTRERFVPTEEDQTRREHYRYELILDVVAGKDVLHLLCGDGYGSFLIAGQARSVVGINVSKELIRNADESFGRPNLTFQIGSATKIDKPDDAVDIVVSFESFEHLLERDDILAEIRRVLVPFGTLIISFPKRTAFDRSANEETKVRSSEVGSFSEFDRCIRTYFPNVQYYGRQTGGDLENKVPGGSRSVFWTLFANGEKLQDCLNTNFAGTTDFIAFCNSGLYALPQAKLGVVFAEDFEYPGEKRTQDDELQRPVNSILLDRGTRSNDVEELELLLAERDQRITRLTSEIAKAKRQIGNLRRELGSVYNSRSWRITSPLRKLFSFGGLRNAPVSSEGWANDEAGFSIDFEIERKVGVAARSDKNGDFKILLVSHYCPTRAHAGGLRILDMYSLIRENCPSVQIDLLTNHKPSIDWSIDDAISLFDNVFLAPTENLTPKVLSELSGGETRYDIVDLQFHPTAYHADAFRNIGSKIIFTPMESMARSFFLRPAWKDLSSKKQIVDNARRLRSAYEEIRFVGNVDEVVCVSRSDAAFLRKWTRSKNVKWIETGISQSEFSEALSVDFEAVESKSRECRILYIAYFGSETNADALRWYLEKVHQKVKESVPGYIFTVVGRGDLSQFLSYGDGSIDFVGEVSDLTTYIKKSRVGIAPAIGGSGFRGKVNQYSIYGIPSVVSPVANSGLAYRDSVNIFVAETPELFAKRCVQLLTDFELNDSFGKLARDTCLNKYTWQSKWKSIRKIYNLGGRE